MIVWINGGFGVGKTSVAKKLVELWDGAILLDPERIGFVVSRVHPAGRGRDFQDLRAWRTLTVRAVALASKLRRHVVVPMTVVDPLYFDEIVGTLRERHALRHFTLLASPPTIRDRLRARGSEGSWAEDQIARCTGALTDPRFAVHVRTEDRSIEDVARRVLDAVSG